MGYKIEDILDIPKLQDLMETFYVATGIPSSLIDPDGNVLAASEWQEICTKFHRQHPKTKALCIKSDQYINEKLHLGEPYICYQCSNGLFDAAVPIVIDGRHLASVFYGQVFLETPNIEDFKEKAVLYGFDEAEYLEAVSKVPIISTEKMNSIMKYLERITDNLVQSGINKLKLLKSQKKELYESRQLLKVLFENTPNVAVRVFDSDKRLTYWNETADKIFNCSSSEYIPVHAEFRTFIDKNIELDQQIGPLEWNFKMRNGLKAYLYSTILPFNHKKVSGEFILLDVNVTEQRRLADEMARVEKLHLIGEMAASLGHEIRNPLTSVRGFLQMLSVREESNRYNEYYDLMIEELDRANAIISEFLSLAKNKTIKLHKINLNTIISALSQLIQVNAVALNHRLILELGEIPDLYLDEQEIRQLLLNLVRNGIESMTSDGNITIKTYQQNNEVVLMIQDEGHGIEPEVFDKIWTPFFSTKETGTGLGLAVCYSIIARHKADISVKSDSSGTRFFIRFTVEEQ